MLKADFAIVPINSSHFCWGLEPLDDDAAEALLTAGSAELKGLVDDLRRHDVARVSNAQMRALGALLKQEGYGALPNRPVRIATLHHQLLPVSGREEFKSFESLTNLGAVRELFVELGIGVALHGHKHESALYWDYVADPTDLGKPPHRMLVSAASGEFLPRRPTVRILEINQRQGARDILVKDVAAPARQAARPTISARTARIWADPSPDKVRDAMTVRGPTVADTYARIQSIFDGRGRKPLNDLVCEVEDPSDAEGVPPDYPPMTDVADRETWMKDLIDWWQLAEPHLLGKVTFNHGERLYRRWGDQIDRAASTLAASKPDGASTTRAVILLIDPETEAGSAARPFPSFVLVQVQLVRDGGARRLDCTGYFRKQEMRYWWPINVAELASVQSKLATRLDDGEAPVRVGHLRTITAQALAEDRIPVVAVPAVDRALDQHPKRLWEMARTVVEPSDANGDPRRWWTEYLSELRPRDDGEPTPISHAGLAQVEQYLDWLDGAASPVGKALHDLVQLYTLVKNAKDLDEQSFALTAKEKLDALDAAIDAALDALKEERPAGVRD